MKKLLLVLMVAAMASFLLVGCLPGGTTPDPDPDPTPTPTPTVTITTTKLYSDPLTGKNYVPGSDKVTVTFSEALEASEQVQVAVKWWNATTEAYVYLDGAWATSTDGKVWTVTAYPFNNLAASVTANYLASGYEALCDPICLVALIKDPCCPGEEAVEKVVFVDDVKPVVIPTIIVKNCDACATVCEPTGAYFSFTTIADTGTVCIPATTPHCTDVCSGVGAWNFKVDKAVVCDTCVAVSGTGCSTLVGSAACGCLPYVDVDDYDADGNKTYILSFDVADNVGNVQATKTWTIIVDTDSVVTVNGSAWSATTSFSSL